MKSKSPCNSLVGWSVASQIDVPASTFKKYVYIINCTQNCQLYVIKWKKGALENCDAAMLMSLAILETHMEGYPSQRDYTSVWKLTCLT